MRIVVANGKGYQIAAKEFQKYYYQITSKMLEIVAAEDYIPKEEDLVLVGASFVNPVSLSMEFDDVISVAEIKAGSDEYIAKTFRDVSRRILFIAGGNVRATLY